MKKTIYSLSIAGMLASCNVLTKTQIAAVNQFAETSKNFSAYPSKIITELANTRIKREVYYVTQFISKPKNYQSELDSAYLEKKKDYKLSDKIDITFQIIDKYAQSLLLLSSDKFTTDLKKQSENFGNDIDSLIDTYNKLSDVKKIPPGIGGLVSQIIVFGGNIYIKSKQGKEIKVFVPKADTLIATMTNNLQDFLTGKNIGSFSIKDLIKNERTGFKEGYTSYLTTCNKLLILPSLESESEYLNTLDIFDNIDLLLDQSIVATGGLRLAHGKLLKAIEEKNTLTESVAELQAYYEEIKTIKTTIAKIETLKINKS